MNTTTRTQHNFSFGSFLHKWLWHRSWSYRRWKLRHNPRRTVYFRNGSSVDAVSGYITFVYRPSLSGYVGVVSINVTSPHGQRGQLLLVPMRSVINADEYFGLFESAQPAEAEVMQTDEPFAAGRTIYYVDHSLCGQAVRTYRRLATGIFDLVHG